jgi:hypothetical protein
MRPHMYRLRSRTAHPTSISPHIADSEGFACRQTMTVTYSSMIPLCMDSKLFEGENIDDLIMSDRMRQDATGKSSFCILCYVPALFCFFLPRSYAPMGWPLLMAIAYWMAMMIFTFRSAATID